MTNEELEAIASNYEPIIRDYNLSGRSEDVKIMVVGYRKGNRNLSIKEMAHEITRRRRRDSRFDKVYLSDKRVNVGPGNDVYVATVKIGMEFFPLDNAIDVHSFRFPSAARERLLASVGTVEEIGMAEELRRPIGGVLPEHVHETKKAIFGWE